PHWRTMLIEHFFERGIDSIWICFINIILLFYISLVRSMNLTPESFTRFFILCHVIIPPLEVDFFLKWFLTLRLYYRTVRPLHQLIYFISRIETKKTKKHCFTRVVSRYIRGLDITNFSIHAFSVHFLLMIGYNEDILSTHAFL